MVATTSAGVKRAPVREPEIRAQLKFDPARIVQDFPRCGQFRFQALRVAIETHKDAAGEKADGVGHLLVGQQRIEGLRIAVQAESQFAASLGICRPQR